MSQTFSEMERSSSLWRLHRSLMFRKACRKHRIKAMPWNKSFHALWGSILRAPFSSCVNGWYFPTCPGDELLRVVNFRLPKPYADSLMDGTIRKRSDPPPSGRDRYTVHLLLYETSFWKHSGFLPVCRQFLIGGFSELGFYFF